MRQRRTILAVLLAICMVLQGMSPAVHAEGEPNNPEISVEEGEINSSEGSEVGASLPEESSIEDEPLPSDMVEEEDALYVVKFTDGIGGKAFPDCTYDVYSGDPTPNIREAPYYIYPYREGYCLAGWDPEISDYVTASVTYTAVWAVDVNHNDIPDDGEARYSVTYKDGLDGTVFEDYVISNLMANTEMPPYPYQITREGYYLDGWDPELPWEVPDEDTVYTAKWISNDRNNNGILDEEEYRTVRFHESWDIERKWDIIVTKLLDGDPTPEPPEREMGDSVEIWEPEIQATVNGSVEYIRYWYTDINHNGIADKDENFTVTYTDGVDDEVIFEDVVYSDIPYGQEVPSFGEDPTRDQYMFAGWELIVAGSIYGDPASLEENIVRRDMVIQATWSQNDRNKNGIADELEYCTVTYFQYPWDDIGEVHKELLIGDETPVCTTQANWEQVFTDSRFCGWDPEWSPTVTGNVEYHAIWTMNAEMRVILENNHWDIYQDLIDPNNIEAAFIPEIGVFTEDYNWYGLAPDVVDQMRSYSSACISCRFINKDCLDMTLGDHQIKYRFGDQILEYTVTVHEPLIASVSIPDFNVYTESFNGLRTMQGFQMLPGVVNIETTDGRQHTIDAREGMINQLLHDEYNVLLCYKVAKYGYYEGPEDNDITPESSAEEIGRWRGTYHHVFQIGYSEANKAEYDVTIRDLVTSLSATDIKFIYQSGSAVQFDWAGDEIYPFYITLETFDGKTYTGHPDIVQDEIMHDYQYGMVLMGMEDKFQIFGDYADAGLIWEPRTYDASFRLSKLHEAQFKIYVLPEGGLGADEEATLLTNDQDNADVPCDVSRDCSTNAMDLLALLKDNSNTTSIHSTPRIMKSQSEISLSIKVADVEATAGETVEVPIRLSLGDSLGAIGLAVDYDHEKMTLTAVEPSPEFAEGSWKANIETGRLVWADSNGIMVGDHAIFATLHFAINDDTAVGTTIPVMVSYDPEGDICTTDMNCVETVAWSGRITVQESSTNVSRPEFKSQSLVLSGEIGVIFYLDLSMLSEEEREASYVEFKVKSNDYTTTDAFDPTCMTQSESSVFYGFTCHINALQMADEIQAVLHYQNEGIDETVEKTYSALQFIQKVEDMVSEDPSSYPQKAYELVKAIADYGYYAQHFLATANGLTLGEGGRYTEMTKHYTDSYDYDDIKNQVENYALTVGGVTSGLARVTYTLRFDSQTAFEIFFTPKANVEFEATASFNNKTYQAALQEDGRYLIRISDIAAHQLAGNKYKIHIEGDADGEFTIDAYALSYVNVVLSGTDELQKKAMSAFYCYYEKAMAFRGN